MSYLELKIPPVALFICIAAAMWGISSNFATFKFNIPSMDSIPLVIALSGILCGFLGVFEFRKAKTTVDPRTPERASQLVVQGIYHWSRNPMYLALLLLLIAWGLHLQHLFAMLLIPSFVWYITRFQIVPEERMMQAKFGAAYQAYQTAVRRWL